MSKFTFLLSVAGLVIGLSSPAEAQLYSWRDANGHLVISDSPAGGASNLRTFPVAKSVTLRTTKPVPKDYRNQYDDLIVENARRYGVRADLVRAVMQTESGFNARARSPKGALGLMQLMPATAADLGVKNAFDPKQNVRGGVAYLRQLLDRYDNNEELALAAYNAGPAAVDRYEGTVPPYRETRDYVSRIRNTTDVLNLSSAPLASSTSGSGVKKAVRRVIYRTIEVIDGHPVPHYSDYKPSSGSYEVVPMR